MSCMLTSAIQISFIRFLFHFERYKSPSRQAAPQEIRPERHYSVRC